MKKIPKEMKNDLFGLVLFFFIGIVFMTLGVYLLISRVQTKSRCDTEVKAVVVDMVTYKTKGLKKHITYAPVIEYEYNGKTYRYTSDVGTKPAKYKRGDSFSVMIDSHSPDMVYMPTDDINYVLFVLIIIAAAVFGTIGICGLVHLFRRRE
jgi:hypothetical protein